MTALRRVVDAWAWVLVTWIALVVCSAVFGGWLYAVTEMAISPFDPLLHDHPFYAVVELFASEPAVAGAFVYGQVVATGLGLIGWTLLTGALVVRLSGVRDPRDIARAWIGSVLGVIAVSLVHLVLRGVLLALLAFGLDPAPPVVQSIVLIVVLGISTVALDLARVRVVLHGAVGWRPGTAAAAFVGVVRRPRILLLGLPLWLGQTGLGLLVFWMGLRGIDGSIGMWWLRLVGLLGVMLGMWRLAWAIDHATVPAPRSAPTPGEV